MGRWTKRVFQIVSADQLPWTGFSILYSWLLFNLIPARVLGDVPHLNKHSMENSTTEPAVTQSSSGRRPWIAVVVVVLAVVAVGLAYWFWSGGQASEEELAAKAELSNLGALPAMDAQRIHVGSINLSTLKSPDTLDRAIELLAELPNLQSLNVDGTKFQDAHAEAVGELDSLENLVLSNTAISDAALAKLEGLSDLTTLYLIGTEVTNAGMPALAQLRSLKILDLSGTKVTGNLSPLRELPNLEHLLVQNLTLDAAAIDAIAEFPSINRLSIRESTYPEESLAQLKQKKAGLAIDE
jgi:hypothetical protein